MKIKITISAESALLEADSEILEDQLADFLAGLGFSGSVESEITGNSTSIDHLPQVEDSIDSPKFHCSTCGSYRILQDAYVDVNSQSIHSVYDTYHCEDCEGETTIE